MSLFHIYSWRAISLYKDSSLADIFFYHFENILLSSGFHYFFHKVCCHFSSCLFQGYLSIFLFIFKIFLFVFAFQEFYYDVPTHFYLSFLEFGVLLKSVGWHLLLILEISLFSLFNIVSALSLLPQELLVIFMLDLFSISPLSCISYFGFILLSLLFQLDVFSALSNFFLSWI